MNAGELFEKITEAERMIKAADRFIDIVVTCKDDDNMQYSSHVMDMLESRLTLFRLLLDSALKGIEYKLEFTYK